MIDPIRELKVRAAVLRNSVRSSDFGALERLRVLHEHRRSSTEQLSLAAGAVQLKHCLTVVAREAGFSTWKHALDVLDGDSSAGDFGELLYPARCSGRLNHWFADYAEACCFHGQCAGGNAFLLVYRRSFFVCDRGFINSLGVSADDADWRAIAWDWVRPRSFSARRRLYGKLLCATRARRIQ